MKLKGLFHTLQLVTNAVKCSLRPIVGKGGETSWKT